MKASPADVVKTAEAQHGETKDLFGAAWEREEEAKALKTQLEEAEGGPRCGLGCNPHRGARR